MSAKLLLALPLALPLLQVVVGRSGRGALPFERLPYVRKQGTTNYQSVHWLHAVQRRMHEQMAELRSYTTSAVLSCEFESNVVHVQGRNAVVV